jgi:hypothetical protein
MLSPWGHTELVKGFEFEECICPASVTILLRTPYQPEVLEDIIWSWLVTFLHLAFAFIRIVLRTTYLGTYLDTTRPFNATWVLRRAGSFHQQRLDCWQGSSIYDIQ